MDLALKEAGLNDAELIWQMQITAFRPLLDKYQDYGYSPGDESLERVIQRIQHPAAAHYLILLDETPIGAIGIRLSDHLCELKRVFILPGYQNLGYAQRAIRLAEALHPNAVRWKVDTILQEAKLCHLYEKLGYRPTGQTRSIKEGMDLVFYAK